MKKVLPIMCAAVMLVATGCSSKKNDDTNTTTLATQNTTTNKPVEELTLQTLFDKAKNAMGEIPATISLDKEMFEEMYGNKNVKEFICEIPAMNVHATEICVVEFDKDVSEKDAEEFFKKRHESLVATWEKYLPDQYEIVKNYKIATRGRYALFCVGEKAENAKNAFLQ